MRTGDCLLDGGLNPFIESNSAVIAPIVADGTGSSYFYQENKVPAFLTEISKLATDLNL